MGLRCPRFNLPQGHSSNSGSYATNWDLSLVRRLHIHIKIRGIDGVLLKYPGFTMLSTFSFPAPHKMSNLRDLRVSFQHDSQFDAFRPVPLDLVALFDGVGPALPVVRGMIRALLASAPKQASMRWGLTEGEKRYPSLYQRTLPDWYEVGVSENQVPIPAAVCEGLVKELEGIRGSEAEKYAMSAAE
jgi:hypothetical protein